MRSLVLLLLPLVYANAAKDPTPVTVYYESLCPDSIKFFTSQLYPVYNSSIGSRLNITLIPYGKSSQEASGNDYTFKCHHGPNECYGNKVQACALDLMKDEPKRIALINCLMANGLLNKENYPLRQCGDTLDAPVLDIYNCANTTTGSQLLAKLGNITNSFMSQLKSVPTIVVNNKYDEKESQKASINLRSVVCSSFGTELPPECTKASASTVVLSTLLMATLLMLQLV